MNREQRLWLEPVRWACLGVALVNRDAAGRLCRDVGPEAFGPDGAPALRVYRTLAAGEDPRPALFELGVTVPAGERVVDGLYQALAGYAEQARGDRLAADLLALSRRHRGEAFVAAARSLVDRAERAARPAAPDGANARPA